MDLSKFQILYLLIGVSIVHYIWAETEESNEIRKVSSSLNQFALNLLAQISEEAGDSMNIALSPYTVWSLMTIIDEGARKNTAREMEDVLKIPPNNNKDSFRRSYKALTKSILQMTNDVQLDLASIIFTTNDQTLNRTYQSIVDANYEVKVIPTDFHHTNEAIRSINDYVAEGTGNRVQDFVNADDLVDAVIIPVSASFFKGQWKIPFNHSFTHEEAFFDESGKPRGQVKMMFQTGSYPYNIIPSLKAHAVELPYGDGDRMSMIVILPRKNEPLNTFLKHLAKIPFTIILEALSTAVEQFGEEAVQVYLPKFTIYSELYLNRVLMNMGIKDVFDYDKADLLGMFPHYLYVSRVIQLAQIEVSEESTVASSAGGATLTPNSQTPTFYANRDFAYFIIDKQTKSIIFEGKVTNTEQLTNPNAICATCSRKNN